MFYRLTVWVCAWTLGCGLVSGQTLASDGARGATLADYIDVDARLFLEIRDVQLVRQTPAGAALGNALAGWVAQVRPVPTVQGGGELQPTGNSQVIEPPGIPEALEPPSASSLFKSTPEPEVWTWRKLFAEAVGLDNEAMTDLLLDGQLAVAADGLQELSAAILVARPTNLPALESRLGPRQITGTMSAPALRRYTLGHNHELACDGQIAVIGIKGRNTDLYARTLALLQREHGVSLADLAEFRERMSEIPAGSQVVLYLGTNRRRPEQQDMTGGWWPLITPIPRSAAVGIRLTDRGVEVESTGRLDPAGPPPSISRDPPIEALLFLPLSTVAAWTQPIDFIAQFQRFKSAYPEGTVRFFIELLQWQMAPGAIERDLLKHLVGDSVLMIAKVAVHPQAPVGGTGPLLVPTFALTVETDNPDSVESTLQQIAGNLLRLMNLQSAPEDQIAISEETIGDRGATIRSIALGRLVPAGVARELFGSLELSWSVSDRWLVLATHRETVRQIILARRNETPLMPAEAVQQAMNRDHPPRRLPDLVLVAQPGAASEMIDSWLRYVDRYHPEMLEPQWWQQIRRQYWASQVQLGILPALVRTTGGEVEVAQTLPNWPAYGRLQSGDRIVAVDGQRLHPQQAMQSLRDRVAKRNRDDRVVLTIIRAGQKRDIDIPMPASGFPGDYVQPLSLLRQVSELSRLFAFASYTTWQPSRDRVRTRLELRLTTTDALPGLSQLSNTPSD